MTFVSIRHIFICPGIYPPRQDGGLKILHASPPWDHYKNPATLCTPDGPLGKRHIFQFYGGLREEDPPVALRYRLLGSSQLTRARSEPPGEHSHTTRERLNPTCPLSGYPWLSALPPYSLTDSTLSCYSDTEAGNNPHDLPFRTDSDEKLFI